MGYMTDGLTFNVLRAANTARLPTFKNRKGEIAHSQADGSDWSDAEWFEALVGEIGEFANIKKKIRRGDIGPVEGKKLLADEDADIMTYFDLLMLRLDIDLGAAVIEKFNEVSERVGSPVQISEDGSDYRLVHPDADEFDDEWNEDESGDDSPDREDEG